MSKVIEAIFENGVFKPLEKVDVPEHKKLRIILTAKAKTTVKRRSTLERIIDIAKDCHDTDLSIHHDKYLYGGASD